MLVGAWAEILIDIDVPIDVRAGALAGNMISLVADIAVGMLAGVEGNVPDFAMPASSEARVSQAWMPSCHV